MQTIPLTNSDAMAQVSDEDYEYLAQFKWYAAHDYAMSTLGYDRRGGVRHTPEFMHRIIMERLLTIPDKFQIDHVDRNRLNNQRDNLRICADWQNMANIACVLHSSQYKGVSIYRGKWRAQISIANENRALGTFNTEQAAASAYNKAARARFGTFAVLNDVPEYVEDAPSPPKFKNRKGSSKYRGVVLDKRSGHWRAALHRQDATCYLGSYLTKEEAARAYDKKVRELFGDVAPLNFPNEC